MYDEEEKKIREILDRNFKSEAHLENYFEREVKVAGGWAIKFNSVGTNGLPDRIVFYGGCTWLVELKTPKGTIQEIQKFIHKRFLKFGFRVRIVRDKKGVADFIQDMLNIEL